MLVERGRVVLSQALIEEDQKGGVEMRLGCNDIMTMEFKFRCGQLTDYGLNGGGEVIN